MLYGSNIIYKISDANRFLVLGSVRVELLELSAFFVDGVERRLLKQFVGDKKVLILCAHVVLSHELPVNVLNKILLALGHGVVVA